jgi:hypothetical protein
LPTKVGVNWSVPFFYKGLQTKYLLFQILGVVPVIFYGEKANDALYVFLQVLLCLSFIAALKDIYDWGISNQMIDLVNEKYPIIG